MCQETPVHGRDRIKNVNFYSLLALSAHKNVKCYPTMTKDCVQEAAKPWMASTGGGESAAGGREGASTTIRV